MEKVKKRQFVEYAGDWGVSPEGYYSKFFNYYSRFFLYFICDEDSKYLKIGISKEPEERIKALQTGCPLKLILLLKFYGTQEIETKLHDELKEYRLRGEWYSLTDENGWKVKAAIKELCLGYFCGMTMPTFNIVYGDMDG